MKILFVTARYPPLLGGTEIHTSEVARAMANQGHDVAVLTTDRSGSLPGSENVDGVEVQRVRAHPPSRDYYLAPAAISVLRNEQPDLVHIQGYHTGLTPLALAVMRRTRQPFVLSFHSGGAATVWRRMLRPVQQKVLAADLRRALCLIAVSDFEKQLFADQVGATARAIEVVRNGVSEAMYTPDREIDRDPNLISTIGRLESYKNHQLTIEAFAIALRSRPNLRLQLVGRGFHQDCLEKMVADYRLQESVTFEFIPPENRQRIGSILRSSAVSVQVSSYESEGIGVIEALAAGGRVIVTDGTALSEHTGKNGVTSVPSPPTAIALAASLCEALDAGPRTTVDPPRTWLNVADDLLEIYGQVLS